MSKHPWFLKNYHPSEKEAAERRADKFYWICFSLSGVCFGAYAFWINYLELMSRAVRELSIPTAIMAAAFIMLLGAWFSGSLSKKGKYMMGAGFFVATLVITRSMWMLMRSN